MAVPNILADLHDINTAIFWRGFRAFAWNLPLDRRGVYLIIHIGSGKPYIGIGEIVSRRLRAHSVGHSPRKLRAAIHKHGRASFLIFPLYYGDDDLFGIEADLITVFNSIAYGYNIIAAGGRVGPYGEEFSRILRAAKSVPASRQRQSLAASKTWEERPEVRDAFHAGRDRWVRENGDMLTARMHEIWADPEKRTARIAAMKVGMADPEFRARRGAAVSQAWTEERRASASVLAASTINSPAAKAKSADGVRRSRRDPEVLARQRATLAKPDIKQGWIERTARRWNDPEYRERMTAMLRANAAAQKGKPRKSRPRSAAAEQQAPEETKLALPLCPPDAAVDHEPSLPLQSSQSSPADPARRQDE